MPRNGSGTYTLPEPAFVAGTIISSAAVNDDLSDIATALTGSLPRDGQAGMTGQLRIADGSTPLPGIAFSNDLNTGLYRPTDDQLAVVVGGVQVALFTSNGLQGVAPIGCILDYAGSTAPTLWILCYGQNVSRTTYASLFAIIGTTFGSGDGATTFGLPDLRGRSLIGKDDMGGVASGRITSPYYGADPTVLGNPGGLQTNSLITNHLPPYTPSGTVIAGAVTFPIVDNTSVANGSAGAITTGTNSGGTADLTGRLKPQQAASSFTGAPQGGTSQPFGLLNPSMVMNKIIYAGA